MAFQATGRLGKSGLGLEAQRQAVAAYLNGGDWQPVKEFLEVESGWSSERPKLAEALQLCRAHRAALVVANVSRLTRSVAFLSKLLAADVEIASSTCRLSRGQPGGFCCSRWRALPSLRQE